MTKIRIENMRFKAYHGVYPKENKVGGEYIVDIVLDVNVDKAAKNDTLEDTYNYEIVFQICKKEMAIISKLIEHVAYRIKNSISKNFKIKKKNIFVRVTKCNPPIAGFNGSVAVEL